VETGDDQVLAIGMKFFNTITLAGMPPHCLAFKVGVPIMLLRNLDAALGLCNETRLIIWRLARRLIVTDHWWRTCEEYCQHTAHHHDNKPFEVAIHPTKAPVPFTIGIRYDH
jgi:hypothetical protein